MATGRNDPCPCGSGKKYKKCCQTAETPASIPEVAPSSITANHYVAYLVNEGGRLRLLAQYDAALEMLNEAIALEPKFAPAHFNRGMVYYSMKKLEPMYRDFRKAEALAPYLPEIYLKMGAPFIHLQDFDNAIRVLEKAIRQNPNIRDSWIWLARAHYDMSNDKAAYDVLTQAAEKLPQDPVIRLAHMLYISYFQHSWENINMERERFMRGIEELTKLDLRITKPELELQFVPSIAAYHGVNDKELRQRFAALMLKMCPSLASVAPHCMPGAKRRPGAMRIGFVSENTDVNTTNQFIGNVMAVLARDRELEIFLFSKLSMGEDTVRLAKTLHHYVMLSGDLEESRAAISACELDVVVYLESVNYHLSYFLGFARLAPSQCVWGGFPVTTGIPNMDYYISAHYLDSEESQAHYTEKLLLFERVVAYFEKPKITGSAKTKKEYGLADGDSRNYICPVMLHKLHPDMFDLFATILDRDEKARIVLFAAQGSILRTRIDNFMREKFTAAQYARIIFVPFLRLEDLLHVLQLADAVLDLMHFSFGTTAFISLGVGVPFVTYRNEFARGRTGVYMYERIKMPEMIADTKEAYVDLALRIAQDKQFRQEMYTRTQERSHIFFEDKQSILDFATRLKELVIYNLIQAA